MKKIIDCWASDKFLPRKSQIKVFNWLQENIDKKYFILELPVGSGKSLIGLTLSRYLTQHNKGNSYILTPQRILQKQYENEDIFDNKQLFSLYGKSNYQCHTYDVPCNIGSLVSKCESCTHKIAVSNAKISSNLVMNYQLALFSFNFTQNFDEDKRSLMVCDEAHNLEDFLVNFNALSITANRCERFNTPFKKFKNIEDAYNWVSGTYMAAVDNYYTSLSNIVSKLDKGNLTKANVSLLREYESLAGHIETIIGLVEHDIDYVKSNCVLVSDNNKIEFKPIFGSKNFNDILKPKGKKFLFMSSTILDHEEYCKNIGIDIKDVAFLSITSEFPIENRQNFFVGGMKMNAKWNDPTLKKSRENYLENLDMVINHHEGEKGIIHTGNFAISEFITEHLEKNCKSHLIFHHNPKSNIDRNDAIAGYLKSKKPAILISPSITEGLDLKNDFGRFSIIGKIPYPYLGDPWVKKRLELSQRWYTMKAVKDVIQASGRVVRSDTDYGTTYILDDLFLDLYARNHSMFPKWWKDAYSQL